MKINELTAIPTGIKHINIFDPFIINNELYVDEANWFNLIDNYPEQFIIQEISDAIVKYGIKLPYCKI